MMRKEENQPSKRLVRRLLNFQRNDCGRDDSTTDLRRRLCCSVVRLPFFMIYDQLKNRVKRCFYLDFEKYDAAAYLKKNVLI